VPRQLTHQYGEAGLVLRNNLFGLSQGGRTAMLAVLLVYTMKAVSSKQREGRGTKRAAAPSLWGFGGRGRGT
jgi:hypothetical protein